MRPDALIEEFQRLPRPSPKGEDGGRVFSVLELRKPRVWLAKTLDGRPAFLIRVFRSEGTRVVPVELPNLGVHHGCDVLLHQEGVPSRREVLSVLECRSGDPEVRSAFVHAVGNALPANDPELDEGALERLIDHLLELFRAFESAPLGTVLGLWGELFVMATARNTQDWVRAWHADPTARFDFSAPLEEVDVKTTLQARRTHVVGLDQLVQRTDRNPLLISIQTEENPTGPSLESLRQTVLEGTVQGETRAKIDRLVIQTLGRDWTTALQRSFDADLAKSSLRVYRCADVPRVTGVPSEVSGVRFRVDLTHARPMEGSGFRDNSLLQGLGHSTKEGSGSL